MTITCDASFCTGWRTCSVSALSRDSIPCRMAVAPFEARGLLIYPEIGTTPTPNPNDFYHLRDADRFRGDL
jgi:hypothetical protein